MSTSKPSATNLRLRTVKFFPSKIGESLVLDTTWVIKILDQGDHRAWLSGMTLW